MWQILQKDILQGVDEFDVSVADWATLPVNIASVAELNNKLQRLVSGAKLNKAGHFCELIKSVQNFLEGEAGKKTVLDGQTRQLLSNASEAMRELASADSPAEHYQNCLSRYQTLSEKLQPAKPDKIVADLPKPPFACDAEKTCEPAHEDTQIRSEPTSRGKPEASSIVTIFLQEVEAKTYELIDGLLKVEKGKAGLKDYEEMMRNAHSLKGGAHLSGLDPVVTLTHELEDVFSAAQQGKRGFSSADIDALMQVVDLLPELANSGQYAEQEAQTNELLNQGKDLLAKLSSGTKSAINSPSETSDIIPNTSSASETAATAFKDENLQNIVRMVSDMKIDSQRLLDMSKSFNLLYKRFSHLGHQFSNQLDSQDGSTIDPDFTADFKQNFNEVIKSSRDLFDEYEQMSVNSANVLGNLSREALACRMGVFGDCLLGIPRLVRNLSKKQNKLIELVVEGSSTPVDKDIITPLIPVLTHLVQNAIDHGIESPKQRVDAGKNKQATLKLTAEHRSGYLNVRICDDGQGIDLATIKKKIVAEGMVTDVMVGRLSDDELLSFIFLPRFTLKQELTQVSGRGVGLDIVHSFIVQAQGKVKVQNQLGQGVQFEFRLPVSLATIRCVIVEVSNEIYALPVSQIDRVVQFDVNDVYYIEGRPVISHGGEDVYLFRADQQLGVSGDNIQAPEKLIVLKSPKGCFGFMVNDVKDEIELVDRPLHAGMGKLRDVRTASALPDGTPVLILDTEDLMTSMEKSLYEQSSSQWQAGSDTRADSKRVLVVDDSLTVREVERNMLMAGGYDVDVAVDGVDGWNHLRQDSYDLLVTDIDMPRMNGWELLEKVKGSANMESLPVIIVSYKDRAEDFERGLDSGADSYVTKGSFQDDSFMQTVQKLIGAGHAND